MPDQSLAKIDAVRLALEQAATVQEVKNVLDLAETAKVYARQKKMGEEIGLRIAEYILRAERKLGEILKSAKAAGQMDKGGRPVKKPLPGKEGFSAKLSDADITWNLSSRAQRLADIPQEEFEKKIGEAKGKGTLSAKRILGPGPPRKAAPSPPKKTPENEVNLETEVKEFREKLANWEKVLSPSDFVQLLDALEEILWDKSEEIAGVGIT